jgi:hypothetical protein
MARATPCRAERNEPGPAGFFEGHHMAAELRIDARIPLPEGIMEEADALHAIKPALETFIAAVKIFAGNVTYERVTPKPRGAKGEGDAP